MEKLFKWQLYGANFMDSMPIASDFENIPIRNFTFPLFSCAGCDMIFQKNVGLKIRQRYYEETKVGRENLLMR